MMNIMLISWVNILGQYIINLDGSMFILWQKVIHYNLSIIAYRGWVFQM